MNLLLDIGNSRCKFAKQDGSAIKESGVITYKSKNKIDEIKSIFENDEAFNRVVICSVLNDQFNQALKKVLNDNLISNYYFVDPLQDTFGIKHCYKNPENLGVDRLVAMLAAHVNYSGNKCVIDCGTAVTIDAIDNNGKHHGGVIMPGITTMKYSLSSGTDIANITKTGDYSVLPDTTEDAMYTGCISAVAGGIEYVINTMQDKFAIFDRIIITGGDAEKMIPMIKIGLEHEATLVVDGLAIIAEKL